MKRLSLAAIILFTWLTLPDLAVSSGPHPVEEAVISYIELHMPWPQGAARVEFLPAPRDLSSVSRQAELKVEALGNNSFIGDCAFRVRVMEGIRLVRTEMVRVRIEVLRDHVTAGRALQSGAVLTEEDLRVDRKWVRQINRDGISSLEDALGKQLTTPVRTGTEILSRVLKAAPMIKKGSMVKLVFDNGRMRIITSGLSEEDGAAGAVIRIRNLTSDKVIYARVLGDSLAGVDIL
ncbi:MAG: flagellar basal body P-ring formation chaperone FlgA [Syntrophaceae bacterium]|nr:flagellar basal body P-ring formation chaperone FlgA [Syntrophaceae bacterium]